MASQFFSWLLLIVVTHCGKVFHTANAEKAFVRPNTSVSCPSSSQPCLTFNEYAQEVNQYFVDNNVSFVQNDIYYAPRVYHLNGGAAILVTDNSTLIISGIASFVRNRALAINGGAMYATRGSRITFEESSNISFTENSTTSFGGAISIEDSNLTIYGRALFERNSAGDSGGAIAITGQGIQINCSGRSIIFRNNTSNGGGGAIIASRGASVELRDILFERNTASDGGAVYVFVSSIKMTGALNLVQNSAQWGGAIFSSADFSTLLLTEPLTANFVENSATMSGGAIFFEDNNSVRQSCGMSNNVQNCSIELSSAVNIRLNFNNNDADIAGRIFFGGNLDTCLLSVGGKLFERPLNTIAIRTIQHQIFHLTHFKCAFAKVTA